jgi:hypothetical protein
LNQRSFLQNFSFVGLFSCSEPRGHKVSLKPHTEATRKDPDQKKIPRASFDLLNLCAKFQGHILTRSTLNREATRPQKATFAHVWSSTKNKIYLWWFQSRIFQSSIRSKSARIKTKAEKAMILIIVKTLCTLSTLVLIRFEHIYFELKAEILVMGFIFNFSLKN